MRLPLACLAATLLGLAADAQAGRIDLTLAAGSKVDFDLGDPALSLRLATATTAGVAGVIDGTYCLAGAELNFLDREGLSLTGIAGLSAIPGSYHDVTLACDGSGGFLVGADVVIAPPAGYSAYDDGRLTLDVTACGAVKSGDLEFTTFVPSAVPEPASLAMTALGVGATLGVAAIRRRRAFAA